MKRILSVFFVMMMFLSKTTYAADMKLDVRVNDVILSFDSEPFIHSDRTMVPVRAIAETLGADAVTWNEKNQVITIGIEGRTLAMMIGVTSYLVDGDTFEMDVAPIIADNRTMVPLRFVAETFGCDVRWNDVLNTVEIVKEGVEIMDKYVDEAQYDYEDVLWLARIVHVEGRGIGYEAKLAIANVVLNRAEVDQYPNTVYEVIKDNAYAVQFPPAHKTTFDALEPGLESWIAAKNALDGQNNVEDCLYFNNRPFKSKANDLFKVIEGEYFYY